MTRFGCLWSPHLRSLPGSPASPAKWLDARCRLDRIGVPLLADFDPTATMPWSTVTYEEHFNAAEARERQQLLCFDVLDPGSMDHQRGGIGFHRNTPDLSTANFLRRIIQVRDWLGGRIDLVWGVQPGNEWDFAPRMDSKWTDWHEFHASCLRELASIFAGVRLFTAGHKLEPQAFGHATLNWMLAEAGGFGGAAYDIHWNGQSLAEAEAQVTGFRHAFPGASVACLENTARQSQAAYAELAKRLGLSAYIDFCGEFISEVWGHNPPGIPTRDLAVVNRSGGKWLWNGPNGGAVTEASKALGEFRGGDDSEDDEDQVGDDLNVPAARDKIRDLLDQVDAAERKDNIKKGAAKAIRRHAKKALSHLEAGGQDQPPIPPPDDPPPPDPPPGDRTDEQAVVALLIDNWATQLIRPRAGKPAKWVATGPRSDTETKAGEHPSHGRGPTRRAAVLDYEQRTGDQLGGGSRALTARERELIGWYEGMDASKGPTSVWHQRSPSGYHGDYWRPSTGSRHSGRLGSMLAALEHLRSELGP